MPGPAGLVPIRRKAAAPLIEEQRTQDGRAALHSAPRVKLNATAQPALYQLVYTNFMIGLDHVTPGISTDSAAQGPETTGNNWDDSLPRSTIVIFAVQG
jgi:hypothetical protein